MPKHWMIFCVFAIASPGAELGLASWYGGPFDGRMAASGEIYHEDQLTAAHRVLPFGTRVLVRRSDADRSVVVRINDRGPYVEARIIDVSQAAARELGMVIPGVVPVSLEVVDVGAAASPAIFAASMLAAPMFAVQVGAFHVPENAERTRIAMERAYGTARIVRRQRDGDNLWCVLVGDRATRAEADTVADELRKRTGLGSAFVVQGAGWVPAPAQ